MNSPSWFRSAIIYHLLVDRFAGCPATPVTSDCFAGGTLAGIHSKLDYLTDLGVDTLWLSPFCRTKNYHGYYTTDYFKVDPHFGTEDDLRALIEEAHRRGLQIVADFVPNHCSDSHPFFLEALKNQASPYVRWFNFKRWPDDYLSFLGKKHMPKLNLDYAPARAYIIEAAKHWLALGIDGFRLDHAIGPSHSFWRAFHRAIKRDYPEALLIGEVWLDWVSREHLPHIRLRRKYWKFLFGTSAEAIYREYAGELDGALDFAAHKLFCEFANRGGAGEEILHKALQRHYAKLPADFLLPTFLDNHDMDRVLYIFSQDQDKLRRAASVQFSLAQPPIIYYGTEIGMTQNYSIAAPPPGWDAHALQRQPMIWEGQDHDLLEFYRSLIRKRRSQYGRPAKARRR